MFSPFFYLKYEFLFAHLFTYIIYVYFGTLSSFASGGEYIKKIRKEFMPIKLTKEEYEKLMTIWFGKIPEPNNWNLIIPDHYPPFQGFIVDKKGRMSPSPVDLSKECSLNIINGK